MTTSGRRTGYFFNADRWYEPMGKAPARASVPGGGEFTGVIKINSNFGYPIIPMQAHRLFFRTCLACLVLLLTAEARAASPGNPAGIGHKNTGYL